jgi:hypothetical protein
MSPLRTRIDTRHVVFGKGCDPFERRRLSGAVLADDDGDRVFELQIKPVRRKGRQNG